MVGVGSQSIASSFCSARGVAAIVRLFSLFFFDLKASRLLLTDCRRPQYSSYVGGIVVATKASCSSVVIPFERKVFLTCSSQFSPPASRIVHSNSARKVLKAFVPCRNVFSFLAALSADSLSSYAVRSCWSRPLMARPPVFCAEVTQGVTCCSARPRSLLWVYQNRTASLRSDRSTESFASI